MVHQVLRQPGQPLDPDTRVFMETRLGADLSPVRVHTDARAAESAQAVNAVAYTVGTNVVFGPGQYRPGSFAGRMLLAHELVHVLQQTGMGLGHSRPAITTPVGAISPVSAGGLQLQRRTVREEYATAAFETGPLWDVTLIITGVPDTGGEAVDDFVYAAMDGIRDAAYSLGSGRGVRSRHFRVRMRYRPNRIYGEISQEAFRRARMSVLGREPTEQEQAIETQPTPVPAPAPTPPARLRPGPVRTPSPAPAQPTQAPQHVCGSFEDWLRANFIDPSLVSDIVTCGCFGFGIADVFPGVGTNPVIEHVDCACNFLTTLLEVYKRGADGGCWDVANLTTRDILMITALLELTLADCWSLALGPVLGGFIVGLIGTGAGPEGTVVGGITGAVLGDMIVDVAAMALQNAITQGTPFPIDQVRACGRLIGRALP